MKKIMVALGAVALAASAQAASVNWQSGLPTALDGYTFGDEALTMIVFENTSAYDIGSIWSSYQAGTLAGTMVGSTTDDFDAYINEFMEIAGGASWGEGDTVYGAVIFTHTGADGKVDYYMVNSASATAADAGATLSDLGNTIGGGGSGGGPTSWQAIPEPTSGLLLLLGVAGLALRRRRA